MADTFNVTASFDKSSYNTGDKMTLTISGGAVSTTTSTETLSGTINLLAADGSTSTLALPSGVTVNVTTSTPESVKISSVTDGQGRTYTVAANGLSATATA